MISDAALIVKIYSTNFMNKYKKFKIEKLDTISPAFCAAKWTAPNFYLYTGTTSSCQLPEPDIINLNQVKQDIKYIDNTDEKIKQRELMLDGKRPDKCANCWQVEDAGDDSVISERVLYSSEASATNNYDFTKFKPNESVNLYRVTVAFDSLCNFTCSYCDASQSSSWYADIKKNGGYKHIKGDPRFTYQRLGKNNTLNDQDYEFLFENFCKYVEQNLSTLKNITCLGGEPLISPNFWNFVERISKHLPKQLTLTIITNLSSKENVEKILCYTDYFKEIKISASIENIGLRSEFVRSGLKWTLFEENIKILLDKNVSITLLATISGIALDGFVDFLNWYKPYSDRVRLEVHRLRHPVFQAPQVLPTTLKIQYAYELDDWITKNEDKINSFLTEQLKNIVTILKNECIIYNNIDINTLQKNAQAFYTEFARRHNHNVRKVFSPQLANWILN